MTSPLATRSEAPWVEGNSGTARINQLLFVLIFLSIWSPADDTGYPAYLETARYLLYALTAGAVLLRYGIVRRAALVSFGGGPALWLVALVAYWAISALWSEDLLFSLQRSVLLVLSAAAVASVAANLPLRTISATLLAVLLFYVVSGAFTAMVFPTIGVEGSYAHAGKWRGLVSQKNSFGLFAAMAIILLCAGRDSLPGLLHRYTALRWACIGLSLLCLVMSESRGAFVNLGVGLLALSFFRVNLRFQRYAIALVALLLPIILVLIVSSLSVDEGMISVVGVDLDTNNRIAIWSYAFGEWVGREILGTGFGGFWTLQRVEEFQTLYGWVLPNFHNGYISIIVETGVIGAALFAGLIGSVVFTIVTGIGALTQSRAQVYIALVFLVLAHNAFENTLSRSTNVLLLVLMVSIFAIGGYAAPKPDAVKGARGHVAGRG